MKLFHAAVLLLAFAATYAAAGSDPDRPVCDDGAAVTQTPFPTTQTPVPITQTPAPTTLLPPQSEGWANFTSADGLTTKNIFFKPNSCILLTPCITQGKIKDGVADWSAFGASSYVFVFPNRNCNPTTMDYTTVFAGAAQRTSWATTTTQSFSVMRAPTPIGEYSYYLDQCPIEGGP